MTQTPRTRQQYLSFLRRKIEESSNTMVRDALELSVREASSYDRSDSPLASLARVVEACDAIENGAAAALAKNIGRFEDKLRPNTARLNSRTIDCYIRLRAAHDQRNRRSSEWTGPREETVRRSSFLDGYVKARQQDAPAIARRVPSSAARRLEEHIGTLRSLEAQQDVRFAIQKGDVAQRELSLLKRAIESNFPVIDLMSLRAVDPSLSPPTEVARLSIEQRKALVQLRNKLEDVEQLRHFGMINDGVRIKAIHTGGHFITKSEYRALLSVIANALD